MARTPVTVTVTGAAGQIGYALLFRVASGQLLGPDVPVRLRLLEITPALKAAEGTAMELDDCAFPLLTGIDITDDARTAFDGVNVALLVGARPRTAGMERGDLLEANGGIFKPQGEAINAGAADDVRVLVVGNPANTNALIAAAARAGRAEVALHRDDPPRPQPGAEPAGQQDQDAGLRDPEADDLGQPLGDPVPGPLPRAGRRQERPAEVLDDDAWIADFFIPTVAKRGAAIIEARGASSAASAANAAIDHVFSWVNGTPDGDWTSAAIVSDGSYGVPEGLVSSFPVTSSGGEWEIVQGLDVDDFSRTRIDASVAELAEERDAVQGLGLV